MMKSASRERSLAPAPGEEKEKEKPMGVKEPTRKIESLGWITESSVQPRKRRDIDGVGAASILELQAELYRTQEEVKKIAEGGAEDLDPSQRSRRKLAVPDLFSKKNSGVEERAGKDKLHLKGGDNDGFSASYAALEKKAAQYDKFVRGEVLVDDEEKYNVLFTEKETFEAAQSPDRETSGRGGESPKFRTDFRDSDAPTAGLGYSTKGPNQGTSGLLTQEQKSLIKEVNEETIQERKKAVTLKQKREEAAGKRREQLRHAYIKKKVEELKAASRCASTPSEPAPGDDGAVVADGNP